ncbi:MAG: hypothetical protein ACLUI3_13885 [Christensenellales bacterium]
METVVAKPSMLAAAVLPAMAAAEGIDGGLMSTLEMENMLLCSLVMRRIIERAASMRVFFGHNVAVAGDEAGEHERGADGLADDGGGRPQRRAWAAMSATLRTTLTRPLTVR